MRHRIVGVALSAVLLTVFATASFAAKAPVVPPAAKALLAKVRNTKPIIVESQQMGGQLVTCVTWTNDQAVVDLGAQPGKGFYYAQACFSKPVKKKAKA